MPARQHGREGPPLSPPLSFPEDGCSSATSPRAGRRRTSTMGRRKCAWVALHGGLPALHGARGAVIAAAKASSGLEAAWPGEHVALRCCRLCALPPAPPCALFVASESAGAAPAAAILASFSQGPAPLTPLMTRFSPCLLLPPAGFPGAVPLPPAARRATCSPRCYAPAALTGCVCLCAGPARCYRQIKGKPYPKSRFCRCALLLWLAVRAADACACLPGCTLASPFFVSMYSCRLLCWSLPKCLACFE